MEGITSSFQNQMILGLGCLELDTNQEILLAWQYPNLDAIHPQVITFVQQQPFGFTMKKLENELSYAYYKFHEFWIYQVTTMNQANLVASNPSVLQASFFVISKEFHPEKYEKVVTLLVEKYRTSADGYPSALKLHFQLLITGKMSSINFAASEWDSRKAKIKISCAWLLQLLNNTETAIRLYNALLLKKRIAIYHSNTDQTNWLQNHEEIVNTVRCLPCFLWHRTQLWEQIRPCVDLAQFISQNSLLWTELQSMGIYIVGCTFVLQQEGQELVDADAKQLQSAAYREYLVMDSKKFDVVLDLSTKTLRVTEDHIEEEIQLTKMHQRSGGFVDLFEQCKQGQLNQQQFIKELSAKTNEIVETLKDIKEEQQQGQLLTMESLKVLKQPKEVEKFLFLVALCENLASHL